MSETASQRAIRLMDMIPFLNTHPGITIKQLAGEFNISTNQLISDLNLLFVCGLPGYTPLELIDLSFDDGYVVVKEPQNLAGPRNLTDTEFLYLLIALSTLESQLAGANKEKVRQLREKVRLSTQSRIPVSIVDTDTKRPDSSFIIKEVDLALSERRRMLISYSNPTRDSVLEREISPYRLIKDDDKMYLEAYAHDVKSLRTFNLINIVSCRVLDQESVESPTFNNAESIDVKFKAAKNSLFLKENAAQIRSTSETDVYQISVFQKEWLLRNVIRAASEIEILEPLEIRNEARALASRALSLYQH
jgi:proteasome accessory factor C